MVNKHSAKFKLETVKYNEMMGNVSKEEAEEEKATQIARIHHSARLVR